MSSLPTYTTATQTMMVCGREIEIECEFSYWGGDCVGALDPEGGPAPAEHEMGTLWALEELWIQHRIKPRMFDYECVLNQAMDEAVVLGVDSEKIFT